MRYPPDRPPPAPRSKPGVVLRPVTAKDEAMVARLHAAAFAPSFDYYLFQADPDPVEDSRLGVREMFAGKHGEFLPWASFLAHGSAGEPLGGTIVLRASYGPLLASVHVDPAVQGGGIGTAVVVASVNALRARGEAVIVLNVTEGNGPAVAVYEHLGFVRSLGPENAWYATDRVLVAPDGSPSRRASPPRPRRDGPPDSATNRTPRA
jgi:ribosomal protein S18 acetylase RimI-like enzyme